MEFFDSHAHYNAEQFDEDREDIINKLYKEDITKVVVPGYSLESSKKAIEIVKNVEYMYAICRNIS